MLRKMVGENKYIQMEVFIKGIEKMICVMVLEEWFIHKETFMKGNGITISIAVSVLICSMMVINMLENFKITYKKVINS